ncbi:hypothetical protein BBOR36S_02324 [Brevibacillus borstelensis]|jgi:hypothetical protein
MMEKSQWNVIEILFPAFFCSLTRVLCTRGVIVLEKSFYYPVPWGDVAFLKEALIAMELPFRIEQPSVRLQLAPGEVAIVFSDMHMRDYNAVRELFGDHGKRYPQ